MADIISIGELLIDFTPVKDAGGTVPVFAQNPGGAPANVAVQAARLGCSSAFLGKVGDDMFGRFLKVVLEENGVETNTLLLDRNWATTLAFVQLTPAGDRDFSFYRNPGADTQLREAELDLDAIAGAKLLCFGSLLLTNEPSRSAVQKAVIHARGAGVITAYDPNWRPPLWKDTETGVAMMQSLVAYADVMKVSDEELALITGEQDMEAGAAELLRKGVQLVVCTLGPKGCRVFGAGYAFTLPTYDVQVKDTTGSGDSFFGAFLTCLIESGKKPGALSQEEAMAMADFANAAGSACATKPGAIPALPTRAQIQAVLAGVPKR